MELVLLTEGEGHAHKAPKNQTSQATEGIFFLAQILVTTGINELVYSVPEEQFLERLLYRAALPSSSETPLAAAGSWWYTYAMCKSFVISLVLSANRLCSCIFNEKFPFLAVLNKGIGREMSFVIACMLRE